MKWSQLILGTLLCVAAPRLIAQEPPLSATFST
jgi:hypothetical protein